MSDEFNNAIFEVLAHGYRRRVCEVVASADREYFPIELLAERILESESGAESPSDARVRSLTVKLYHVHLPKLDEAGLLEFDADTKAVTYEGHPVVEAVTDGELTIEDAAEATLDGE